MPWGIILAAALSAAFVATLIGGVVIMSASNSCFGSGGCVEEECIPCGPLRTAAQVHVGGQALVAAAAVFVHWRLQLRRSTWLLTTATVLVAFATVGLFVWWSSWWVDSHS
jgi:hypothetical protein